MLSDHKSNNVKARVLRWRSSHKPRAPDHCPAEPWRTRWRCDICPAPYVTAEECHSSRLYSRWLKAERIRNQCGLVLTHSNSKKILVKTEGKVYATCVSCLMHGSETWPMKVEHELKKRWIALKLVWSDGCVGSAEFLFFHITATHITVLNSFCTVFSYSNSSNLLIFYM